MKPKYLKPLLYPIVGLIVLAIPISIIGGLTYLLGDNSYLLCPGIGFLYTASFIGSIILRGQKKAE